MRLIYFGLFIVLIEAQEVTLISSNLPIIIIDTYEEEIPDEPKISSHMEIIFNGSGEINNITDPFNHYDGHIGIEIRGHSSQYWPKKSYGIETRDSVGENLNVSLFGMPKENDWVLYAPYSDKSFMRNVLTYNVTSSLGSYAPRTQFCEVILNDEYIGIYVFIEKIKQDKNRVDLDDPEPDDLSGGYLLEIDSQSHRDSTDIYFITEAHLEEPYVIKFPKESDITINQIEWIKKYINEFEETLYSSSFNDPNAGYYTYIDVPSWIDFMLINEAFKNWDAFYSSTYLYKIKNGKLYAGPVWDFNYSMGNHHNNFPEGWWLNDLPLSSRLLQDSSFVYAYKLRWNTLRNNQLSISTVNSLINDYAELLKTAQKRNFDKWPILGTEVYPNYYWGDTYEEEVNYLKQWIEDRFIWMDSQLDLKKINVSQTLYINEFSASNDTCCSDENGEYDDFIEIYNSGPVEIDIGGMYITDDLDNPMKYQIPNTAPEITTISSYGFLLLWADKDSEQGVLHLNIKLSGNGESIGFYASDGSTVIDSLTYGEQTSDISYGRNLDGGDVWEFFNTPTPGESNNTTGLGISSFLASNIMLFQSYPNPFNPITSIRYEVTEISDISISIYDMLGRRIKTVFNGTQMPGYHNINWDATEQSSGIYFVQMIAGGYINTQKLMLIK